MLLLLLLLLQLTMLRLTDCLAKINELAPSCLWPPPPVPPTAVYRCAGLIDRLTALLTRVLHLPQK